VVPNTLGVLGESGAAPVPVAAGADRPLSGPVVRADEVHGTDGLGGVVLPSPWLLDPRSAIDLLTDLIEGHSEPVHLIAVGPLTNVARLITERPEVAARLASIFVMGGSAFVGGNVTAAAEFNFAADPEAAHIVVASGLPVTLYGLDVFNPVTVAGTVVDSLADSASPAARLAADVMRASCALWSCDDAPLGDAGAVICFEHSEFLTCSPYLAAVECAGDHTRGQLVIERRPEAYRRTYALDGGMVSLGESIDAAGVAQHFVQTLLSSGLPSVGSRKL
jgi:pyrimidine-specific ribonucleoside hydrolase